MTLSLQTSPSIGDSQGATPPHDDAIPESTGELIAYILDRFHSGHRRDLPGLIVLARKVESVHGKHPEAPNGLADFLDEVAESLEEHMQKEEQILFPMLRSGGHPMISHPIGMMRMEHDDHVINLGKLLALTNGLKAPEGACGSWRALYEGLGELSAELKEHIRIENEILFPRFGA
jgi:regulator of cell morphogenesis and NO signaling